MVWISSNGGRHKRIGEQDKVEEAKMVEKPQDGSIKERVIGLLKKGYTRSQLITDFKFAERTVDSAIKEFRELVGDDPEGSKKDADYHEEKGLALPAKLDSKQVIVPEYLIKHLSFIDGDKKQAAIDMVLIWEVARRSVMEDVVILQGLAEAQSKMTETQLNILRAAKSESGEVAQQAAQQAAAEVAAYFEREKPWLAASPNPMASMMVELMKPILQNMMGRFMPGVPGGHVDQSGAGFSPPPGFSYKEEGK